MHPPAPRPHAALALLAYAAVGALVGVASIAAGVRLDIVDLPGHAPPTPMPSAAASGAACPLHASPAACDQCMTAHCENECLACSDSADCLDLFLCAMDCADPACERACGNRYPDGKPLLQRFVGETGCLPMFCRDACSAAPSERKDP
jgi:hypothetical protein